MICQSVKVGVDCIFMKKIGCSFNGGTCYPVVDSCEGCDRIEVYTSGRYCKSCADPAGKWSFGDCNFATHIRKEKATVHNRLNPLKASKRGVSARQ